MSLRPAWTIARTLKKKKSYSKEKKLHLARLSSVKKEKVSSLCPPHLQAIVWVAVHSNPPTEGLQDEADEPNTESTS